MAFGYVKHFLVPAVIILPDQTGHFQLLFKQLPEREPVVVMNSVAQLMQDGAGDAPFMAEQHKIETKHHIVVIRAAGQGIPPPFITDAGITVAIETAFRRISPHFTGQTPGGTHVQV